MNGQGRYIVLLCAFLPCM